MVSIPGVEEARNKARNNRPDYIQKALDKVGELIREAAGSGNLSVDSDLTTILPGLYVGEDHDKNQLALQHLTMELSKRGYHFKDYKYSVPPKEGSVVYETRRGFYIYWGWDSENLD